MPQFSEALYFNQDKTVSKFSFYTQIEEIKYMLLPLIMSQLKI